MNRATMPGVPTWLRAVLALDRAMVRAHAVEAALRDELAWSLVPSHHRGTITRAIYASTGTYAPGGAAFEAGLFAWEEALLARPEIPRGGHVLLGGAGGGRELRALCQRGYAVTAIEPCAALAHAAGAVAAPFAARARVLCGAYEDVPAAVRREGPLASLAAEGATYALIMLGWRSLSHVLDTEAQIRVLRALSALAPTAPIVASFLPERARPAPGPRRMRLRRALRALGAPAMPPPNAAFIPHAGFAVALGRPDLEAIASATGRRLALYETHPEGVAVFLAKALVTSSAADVPPVTAR